jgi:transcriptional regulator with PAS, ATPase and Fis domain
MATAMAIPAARIVAWAPDLDTKPHPPTIVGESAPWREVVRRATRVANTDTTVLITGESGTGKEVVARFIHRQSVRSDGPFVALNCAALPEQLLESELFGYERGAFTGAQQSKPGQVELAAGGVFFLDEVSEMSLAAQAKFLRLLEQREFQRLGGTRALKTNVRVLAATNRDLATAVDRGAFREDLFYRLNVFDIPIPPLRERVDDILPLSAAFLQELARSFGHAPARLSSRACDALLRYEWRGNVRQLRNALERAAIVCEGNLIEPADLGLDTRPKTSPSSPPTTPPVTNLAVIERETIARVLHDTRWNKCAAAKRLGLSRSQLYERIHRYGLEPRVVVS